MFSDVLLCIFEIDRQWRSQSHCTLIYSPAISLPPMYPLLHPIHISASAEVTGKLQAIDWRTFPSILPCHDSPANDRHVPCWFKMGHIPLAAEQQANFWIVLSFWLNSFTAHSSACNLCFSEDFLTSLTAFSCTLCTMYWSNYDR